MSLTRKQKHALAVMWTIVFFTGEIVFLVILIILDIHSHS